MAEAVRAPARAPVIGLTASLDEASWCGMRQRAAVVERAFLDKLAALGACTVVVPPDRTTARQTLGMLDGLLLSGGGDLDPHRYGAELHPRTEPTDPARDAGDLALARAAVDADLPVLGVCRGCQVLTVALGGSLTQHVPDVTDQRHSPREPRPRLDGAFFEHRVRVAAGSLLERVAGHDPAVQSDHHQAVADPGPELTPVAWSDDGLIEAVEHPARRFALGVQWHPEAHAESELFEAFVAAAAGFAA